MPVTATVLKKGSTIPGEEFACAQVNLSFFFIFTKMRKFRHICKHCEKMPFKSKVGITGFEGGAAIVRPNTIVTKPKFPNFQYLKLLKARIFYRKKCTIYRSSPSGDK
jgi:hypothetical protein